MRTGTQLMFRIKPQPVAVSCDTRTAKWWIAHLRECVAMGVSREALIEKERIAKLFIRNLAAA